MVLALSLQRLLHAYNTVVVVRVDSGESLSFNILHVKLHESTRIVNN